MGRSCRWSVIIIGFFPDDQTGPGQGTMLVQKTATDMSSTLHTLINDQHSWKHDDNDKRFEIGTLAKSHKDMITEIEWTIKHEALSDSHIQALQPIGFSLVAVITYAPVQIWSPPIVGHFGGMTVMSSAQIV